jgi:hypothetical protein
VIFKLQVVVIADDGQQETYEITSVERKDLKPATLGLTLAEGKAILKDIQEIVIQRQAALCLATYRQCPDCGNPRTGNGYHNLSVRTVFGYLKVKSARLHHCGCRPHESKTFSTLSRRARKMALFSKGCSLPDGPIHLLIDSTGLKVFGAGEWLQEKHGARARRTWKKLHLAVDADTGIIMASTLTGNDVGDPSQVAPLLDQIEAPISGVTADGAYDGAPTYEVVAAYSENIRVIIPPHVTAVLSAKPGHNPSQRDQHIVSIAAHGRLGWQKETDYGQRALVETAMGRYKAIIGPRLRARSFSGQQAEAAVAVAILNRMLNAGRPDSVRALNVAA